ncbi:MAG TPA: hypothetical protein EYN70_09115, partial [Planctomycetaceae bacterium]|nr:hypothetical protein [Planctomycetaceae bacterium]
FKSFSYRIQYWQSALGIIMADPLLGCGSGNFQQYFSQFKLPETSETVADPHNFILEIWATAGTLTLLAVGWLTWTFCRESSTIGNPEQADGQQDQASNVMPVYLGAMVGGSVPVFLLTSHELFLVLPFLLVIFGINKLHPWVQAGSLSPRLLKVALAGWLINLLAVGGIGIPGVAVTGWLLLALALPRPVIREGALKRRTSGLLLVASLFLMVAFYITGLLPIYRAAGHLAAGNVADGQAQQQWIQGRSEQAEQHWEKARISWLAATRSDPYSSLPWMELTRLSWQRWQHFRRTADYQQMQHAAEQAIRLNRHSYVVQAMIGDWHLVSYAGQYSERLDLALQAYRQAHRFYPNSAILTARLAWLYDLRGEPEKAAREAQRSLELDSLNPHMEFKLSLRHVFEGSSLEGLAYLPLTNARQAMENLRSGSLEGKKQQ